MFTCFATSMRNTGLYPYFGKDFMYAVNTAE